MTVDKVIAKIIWLTFFWPTLYIYCYFRYRSLSQSPEHSFFELIVTSNLSSEFWSRFPTVVVPEITICCSGCHRRGGLRQRHTMP